MTDRYHALTVVLDDDIRDDDAEAIINAIRMIRGVADVTPHVVDPETHSARIRARSDVRDKLIELVHNL